MIGILVRVFAGFLLACLIAGFVQVLFVLTPLQLLGAPASAFGERAGHMGVLSLLSATHAAIFSAAFVLIVAGIGEWIPLRSWLYYVIAGAAIGLFGLGAQYASEVAGQPTILNAYAATAYFASGALAGLVYWLVAGQYAGSARPDTMADDDVAAGTSDDAPASAARKDRPRIVVEDNSEESEKPAQKQSLAKRLAQEAAAAVKSGKALEASDATAPAPAKSLAEPAKSPTPVRKV